MEQNIDRKALIRAAFAAREYAYTPYSNFKVGAALLAKNGSVYTGCNIECATFTPTNCAERTALFNTGHHGEKRKRLAGNDAGRIAAFGLWPGKGAVTFFDKKRPFCSAPVQPDGPCPAARFQEHAAALLKHLHSGAVKNL